MKTSNLLPDLTERNSWSDLIDILEQNRTTGRCSIKIPGELSERHSNSILEIPPKALWRCCDNSVCNHDGFNVGLWRFCIDPNSCTGRDMERSSSQFNSLKSAQNLR